MKDFILLVIAFTIILTASTINAGELYVEAAVAKNNPATDTFGATGKLGVFTIGHQWDSKVFIEFQHVSDVDLDDRGLNMLVVGIRKSWKY